MTEKESTNSRIPVNLPPYLKEWLVAEYNRTRISQNALIVLALEEFKENRESSLEKQDLISKVSQLEQEIKQLKEQLEGENK